MSYNDVYKLRFSTFKEVKEIVANTKPYRGSTNIYPLGDRRYSDRTFVFNGDHIVIRYGVAEVLKFHEDDSIEFTRDSYWGGMNMMLSAFLYPKVVKSEVRMGGDIAEFFRLIVCSSNDSVFGNNNSTHRYFSFIEGEFGLLESLIHEILVGEKIHS